jgi:hypothetical protein
VSQRAEDPVLVSARREAIVVLIVWIVAMTWTVGYCALYGYGRDPASIRYLLGVPDWAVWGLAMPWLACLVFSWAFATFGMRDEDLGVDETSDGTDEFGTKG